MSEELHAALLCTYSPDRDERQGAEAWLNSNGCAPGFLPSLLQFVAQPEVDKPVRQAAGLSLKNVIKKHWALALDDDEQPIPGPCVPDEDKAVLRDNIVGVVVSLDDKSLRSIMSEAVMRIAFHDFPDTWPGLLGHILEHLQSDDTAVLFNVTFLLRKLTKTYEVRKKDKRRDEGTQHRGTTWRTPNIGHLCHSVGYVVVLRLYAHGSTCNAARAIQNIAYSTRRHGGMWITNSTIRSCTAVGGPSSSTNNPQPSRVPHIDCRIQLACTLHHHLLYYSSTSPPTFSPLHSSRPLTLAPPSSSFLLLPLLVQALRDPRPSGNGGREHISAPRTDLRHVSADGRGRGGGFDEEHLRYFLVVDAGEIV